MPRVAVIGGGIAGLSAALRLTEMPDVDVVLVERDDRLGGKILTRREAGFTIECGPDGFIAWKPQGAALCARLGVEVVRSAPGRSAIVGARGLRLLPAGLGAGVPTRLMPALTSSLLPLSGKLRLLAEPLVPRRRGDADESVAAFVRRRAGAALWDGLVEPLVTGIYAGDGERLSVSATMPMLVDAERRHGGLLRAGRAARRAGRGGGEGPTFLTTPSGLGGVVAALGGALAGRVDVRLGTSASGLAPGERGGWTVAAGEDVFGVDGIVLAAPAAAAGGLIAPFDVELARELNAIPYSRSAVVTLAYPQPRFARDVGHGYLVPRARGNPFLACSVASAKFPELARPGWTVARLFVGRHGDDAALAFDDRQLVERAADELVRTAGAPSEPARHWVDRWDAGIPQYLLGHRERVARIDARLASHPGLALAGAAFGGVGIPDCIASGEAAADRVMAVIRSG